MYIRNAQGQLMWIPPQGFTPPTQPTLQALQQNMRQQMQQDEWTRFNAPPPDDNLHFHDDFSHYEGSVANGYHNVSPPFNSPTGAIGGNTMFRGQHPYNRIDPPIPQVIQSPPMPRGIQSPPMPRGIQSPPMPRVIESTPMPRVIESTPMPRVIESTPMPRVIESTPMPRVNESIPMPRVIQSPPMPRVIESTPMPRVNESPPMHRVIESAPMPRVIESAPMPRVIESTPMFRSPPPFIKTNDIDSTYENSELSPSQKSIKYVKEEFIPETKVSCMSTIFGTSVDLYSSKSQIKKGGVMNCNALNVSTSDSIEFDDELSSYFSESQQESVFQCNGIRGPGKKFDYSGEKKLLIDPLRDTQRKEWENDAKDKVFDESKVSLQMARIEEGTESLKSTCEENVNAVVASSFRETIESYATGDAVAEDDSIEERSGMVDFVSTTKKDVYPERNEQERSVPFKLPGDDFQKKNVEPNIDSYAEHRRVVDDYPSFDEGYPSFDEPAKHQTNSNVNTDKLTNVCSLTEDHSDRTHSDGSYSDGGDSGRTHSDGSHSDGSHSDESHSDESLSDISHYDENHSDGENTQRKANLSLNVEKMSISKRPTLTCARETKPEFPGNKIFAMNLAMNQHRN